MDKNVQKARDFGTELKALRLQELELRARRSVIREEWGVMYKKLKGNTLRDACQAYWDSQRDQDE